MATEGGDWLDAQPFLRRVCDALAVGELLHGPSFCLFDSTTAIEIGDPKMDIGLHRDRETGTAEELIAGGGAPVNLAPPVVLAVMDRLLCLEATWHTGSMLPQTVFTSLYMLQPDRLAANQPLHAFCLALRSTCTVFVDMVHAAAVTEDEDFYVHTFGVRMLDLPGSKPLAAALQVLATVEEQLEQWLAGTGGGSGSSSGSELSSSKGSGSKSGKGSGSNAGSPQQQQQQGSASEDVPAKAGARPGAQSGKQGRVPAPTAEQAAALLARIRFRRLILEALQSLQLYSQAGLEAARRQCQLATAQLQIIADSASLAAPAELAPGFVPDVNRRHMGLVPPRPVHHRTLDQAIEHWRGLLSGLADAAHSLLFVKGSWPLLKATLTRFAAKNYHSIVRSAMHLQLIKPLPPAPAPPPTQGTPAAAAGVPAGQAPDQQPNGSGSQASGSTSKQGSSAKQGSGSKQGGSGAGKRAAKEVPPWCPEQEMVCREFGVAPTSLPCADAAMFVEQAAIALQGQAYALCLNRCRQRRRLRRQLEDWRNIFDHAYNADVTPEVQDWLARAGWRWPGAQEGMLHRQGPAATWAERESAACALLHLQLGFPLELYASYEYLQIYWYCDYLLECQQRLGLLLHHSAPAPAPSAAGAGAKRGPGGSGGKQRGGKSGGSGRGIDGVHMGVAEQAAATREVELVVLEVERNMCQGMFRAAIALTQLGCLVPPASPFSAEEQRYEQRFAFLEQLCRPEALPFQHFHSSTDAAGLPPARVLASALANFQRAAERAGGLLAAAALRALLREEQVQHLEGVQRTATQNAVAVKLLAATSAKAASTPAGSDTSADAAAAASAPPFKVQFDFKVALSGSIAQFYPTILLKR